MTWNIQSDDRLTLNRTSTLSQRMGAQFGGLLEMGATTTGAQTADVLRAIPIFIPNTMLGAKVSLENTVAAGNVRLGLYKDSGGYPGALVFESGSMAVAVGIMVVSNTTIILPRGLYWMACVMSASATWRLGSITNALPWLGFGTSTGTTYVPGYSVAHGFAALPDPFTGGGTELTAVAPRLVLGAGKEIDLYDNEMGRRILL